MKCVFLSFNLMYVLMYVTTVYTVVFCW